MGVAGAHDKPARLVAAVKNPADTLTTLRQRTLKTMLSRLVIHRAAQSIRQVLLRRHVARRIMRINVAVAVTKLLSPRIMGITQMHRHLTRSARTDIRNRAVNRVIRGVRLRRERTITLMRWGWKRLSNYDSRWFWPLTRHGVIPPNDWNTYGTNWQAYKIDLPDDISDMGIRRRRPSFRFR